MPGAPTPEAANTLTIDLQDNIDLQQLFASKEVGDHCVLTLTLQIVSKDTKQVQSIVEKIADTEGQYGDSSAEDATDTVEPDSDEDDSVIEPTRQEPVMMTMAKKRWMQKGGPISRTPEPVENSLLPTVQSYA